MPWKKVNCNLNYKDKCPGIIYKKDFADFRKKYKCRAPKGRKEVGISGICRTCSVAQRTEVRDARLRNEILCKGSESKAGGSDGGVKGGGGDGGSGREDGSGGKGSGEDGSSEDGTAGEGKGSGEDGSGEDGTAGEGGNSKGGGLRYGIGKQMNSLAASQGSIGSIPICSKVSGEGGSKDGITPGKGGGSGAGEGGGGCKGGIVLDNNLFSLEADGINVSASNSTGFKFTYLDWSRKKPKNTPKNEENSDTTTMTNRNIAQHQSNMSQHENNMTQHQSNMAQDESNILVQDLLTKIEGLQKRVLILKKSNAGRASGIKRKIKQSSSIIKHLMGMGVTVTINHTL